MSVCIEADIAYRVGNFSLSASLSLGREIGVLFGPSGAGKSMLLRLLAGLERPSGGRIVLAGRCVVDIEHHIFIPARERQVGMVFQHLALFPHLTALENVSYGLHDSKRSRASEWLARVHLAGLEHRFPSQLSGGQRQRIALARALAAGPNLLLLDEPFSALDGPLRRSLRRELKNLHRETGVPMLYVTHAVEDVCSLGDRVFFLEGGRTRGNVAVEDLWSSASDAAYRLLGWGNLLRGEIVAQDGMRFLDLGGMLLALHAAGKGNGIVNAFVAPSDVKLLYPDLPLDPGLGPNILHGTIVERVTLGSVCRISLLSGDAHWQVEFPSSSYETLPLHEGSAVRFAVPPERITILGERREPI